MISSLHIRILQPKVLISLLQMIPMELHKFSEVSSSCMPSHSRITKGLLSLTTGMNWSCHLLKIQMELSIIAVFSQIWISRITPSLICLAFLSALYTNISQEPVIE